MRIRKALPRMPVRQFWFALITAALLCSGSIAHAWGMLNDLVNNEQAHLFTPVFKYHRITYCLSIRDTPTEADYSFRSLNTEVRVALGEWLNAVSDLTGPVALKRVMTCASGLFNLKVDVGTPTVDDNHPSFEQTVDANRPFEYIGLNSTIHFYIGGQSIPIIDFQKLVPTGLDLETSLISLISQKDYAGQIIQWAGLSQNYILEAYDNSFTFILHELGHAFGLCDTYKGADNCDSNYSTTVDPTEQPYSVMKWDRPIFLEPDDVAGIRALFRRFAYLKQ